MKTYVITLSRVFLAKHSKAGEPTKFHDAFNAGQVFNRGSECLYRHPKLHTIRSNYPLWLKRISEIQAGRAVLSVRQWTGKPYRSKQVEIARLTADNGIGIQRLDIFDFMRPAKVDSSQLVDLTDLANNDGLSFSDWYHWFRLADVTKPMVIIHFTKFRY